MVLHVQSTEHILHIWMSTENYGFQPNNTAVDIEVFFQNFSVTIYCKIFSFTANSLGQQMSILLSFEKCQTRKSTT